MENQSNSIEPKKKKVERVAKYEIRKTSPVYRKDKPFDATVLSNEALTTAETDADVRNIVFSHQGSEIEYVEGQSMGVLVPSTSGFDKPRLYSIASSRTGDDRSLKTFTLCVKRVKYIDSESGEENKGLASNYLCDLKEGEVAKMIGPFGKHFALPEDTSTDIIMAGVGTGVAPYRSFIHRMYEEGENNWQGKVYLFFGARTEHEALYMDEVNQDLEQYGEQKNFKLFKALSRVADEDKNKGYIQDRLKENSEEIWDVLMKGTFCLYVCGLKGLEKGILELFAQIAEEKGEDWPTLLKKFKAEGRWNIEVY